MILDYAGPDIHLPIAILLIQILDIPFPHNANLSICHPLLGCQVEFLLQCMLKMKWSVAHFDFSTC